MRQEVDSRARLAVIGVVVVAMLAGLLTRLWFLQVTGGEQLAVAAQQQRDRTVQVPALRGAILDAKGRVLAETVLATALVVDRQRLTADEREELVAALAFFLGLTPEQVEARLDTDQYDPFEPVPVTDQLTEEQFVFFAEHADRFPRTELQSVPVRRYPNGTAAAHVLGYVGRISPEELAAHSSEEYETRDLIGKIGLEQKYETALRGRPGLDLVRVDSRGRSTDVVTERAPVPGHDVQLTIDLDVQQVAEESLAQGIEGSRTLVSPDTGNYYDPKGGSVVVMNARTGELLAVASAPTFDPNDFIVGDADQYFADPVAAPMLDRALAGLPPGSTFKTFVAIALAQYGIFDPHVYEYDDGCFEFGNDQKACNAGGHALGSVDMRRAIAVSSDVYFYKGGNNFWNVYRDEGGDDTGEHPVGEGVQHVARTYGFDAPTGVELPGDQGGRIPDRAFRAEFHAQSRDAYERAWRRGDAINLGVGQGDVLVTPLQLANGYAAVANGGTRFVPSVVASVRESRAGLAEGELGALVRTSEPVVAAQTGLDPGIRDIVLAGLDGAVNSGEGTAYAVFRTWDGPTVVGKTGTAQQTGKGDTSWFAAITNPENDPNLPQYVVVANVQEGGFGADVAAPIVRRVLDFLHGDPAPPAVDVAPVNPNRQKQD